MELINKIKVDRTVEIYEDTSSGTVYRIVTDEFFDHENRIFKESDMYIEINRQCHDIETVRDPSRVEELLYEILSSEK